MRLDEKCTPITIPEAEISTRKIEKEAKVSFLDIWQHFGTSPGAVARLETSIHEYLIVVGPWREVLKCQEMLIGTFAELSGLVASASTAVDALGVSALAATFI